MAHTLILIPTADEREMLQPLLKPQLRAGDHVELCGFGLVAAAARTSQLLERLQPERVVLVGIAGTYSDDLPIGHAVAFQQVSCFGIGAGSGGDHLTAGDMGWHHVGGRRASPEGTDLRIGDTITLGTGGLQNEAVPPKQLLSVAAASCGEHDVEARCRRFPDAIAEDMEGFAVAISCQLAVTPLNIVRGISNRAGDRDMADWQVNEALEAASERTRRLLDTAAD